MKIARVFPRRTSMSPNDPNAYFATPDLFTPEYDEVHISVTFTWDIDKGYRLANAWRSKSKYVKIGGPAFNHRGFDNRPYRFIPGMYVKNGVTFTSRGCPNNCPWCLVPIHEGKLRELPIVAGHIVQDNNLLACSKMHLRKVFQMLHGQKRINFSGGLEDFRELRPEGPAVYVVGLRIAEFFFAQGKIHAA